MAYDGTLSFNTSVDTAGFQKGANGVGGLVKGLSVFKLAEKGFQAVANSIDGAISRYDALNNFPRVLERMGFEATDAAAATQKLSDGVQGLPTSLDSVVSTAQRLTVLTGNLEKSTDTTLALNNAFLASGASGDEAARGLDQYIKMLSSGQVDSERFKTLQETMGFALQRTAEAFGFAGESAQNDLYAALKNGNISFDQFNAKLIELNNGVGGFAELAQTSSGGIRTAWTNLQTAMVRGTTEIISSIDSGLSETRFKGIENVINGMKDGVYKALTAVGKAFGFLAKNIEPVTAGVITFAVAWTGVKLIAYVSQLGSLAKAVAALYPKLVATTAAQWANIKSIASAAGQEILLTAAIMAESVAKGANALVTKLSTAAENGNIIAKLALAAATHVAAAATWAFNAALNASPIFLIITALALLTAGVIALVSWLGNSNQAYKEGKEYIEDYGEANKALAEDFDESTSSYNANRNAAEANANTSREMLDGLKELANKGLDRTAEETYQLQAKINALNAAQQGLNLTINETTGELSMSFDAIEAYIAATASAAKEKALEEHMQDLNQQLVDVEAQFIDAARQIELWKQQVDSGDMSPKEYGKLVDGLKNEMTDLEETQTGILKEMSWNEEQYSQLLAKKERERRALLDAQETEIRAFAAQHHLSYEEIRADMDANNLTFAQWLEKNQEALDKGQEKITEFAGKWGFSIEEVNAAIAASGLTIEEYVERQDELLEHANEVLTDYTTTVTDGFTVMEQESAISLNKFIENMEKNREATANWAENMTALMDLGINQGVIQQLAAMGPEGAAQAQKFVDELTKLNGGVDIALGKTNEAVAAKLAEIDQTFNTSLATANIAADAQLRAESYYTAGYASIDKIAAGISENTALTDATGRQMKLYNDILQSTIANADIEAPSAAIDAAAQKVTENTALNAAAEQQGKQYAATLQNAVEGVDFTSITTGVAQAISSGAVEAAAQSVSVAVQGIFAKMGAAMALAAHEAVTNVAQTITARAPMVRQVTAALAQGAVGSLAIMVMGAISAANQMMDGMLLIMSQKANALYKKARDIAANIARALNGALDAPRVPAGGANQGADTPTYTPASLPVSAAALSLALEPEKLASLTDGLRAMAEANPLRGFSAPAAAYAGGAGSVYYSTSLTQNITSPEPLSPAQMTREGLDMLKRSQWLLP